MSTVIEVISPDSLDHMDLTSVDLSRPLIKADELVEVTIKSIEAKPNKAKTGHVLNMTFVINAPVTSTKGDVISPPFEIYDMISLVKTEKFNPAEKLAGIKMCFNGTQAGGFKKEDLIGAKGIVRMSIEDAQGGFPEKNRIARYMKKS